MNFNITDQYIKNASTLLDASEQKSCWKLKYNPKNDTVEKVNFLTLLTRKFFGKSEYSYRYELFEQIHTKQSQPDYSTFRLRFTQPITPTELKKTINFIKSNWFFIFSQSNPSDEEIDQFYSTKLEELNYNNENWKTIDPYLVERLIKRDAINSDDISEDQVKNLREFLAVKQQETPKAEDKELPLLIELFHKTIDLYR